MRTPEHATIDWQIEAECRNLNPDLFFPIGSTGPSLDQINIAKAVCNACVVKNRCLEYALDNRIDTGIWGGTSEKERRRIIKTRRRILPTDAGGNTA